jgi:hypothetical protein
MKGDVPVCFWKGKVTEFSNPDPEYRWVVLKNDLSVGAVTDSYKAGLVQIRLSINSRSENGPISYQSY